MDQPSKTIADRYRLQLSRSWQSWFDGAADRLRLPGAFQSPIMYEDLVAEKPQAIWPGFMLPDTVPVIGNAYGDWICVRIEADGRMGELVHWYHGGGDWIPVGARIEETLLHDAVDQFRPVRDQMLRGAAETLSPNHLDNVLAGFADAELRKWIVDGLSSGRETQGTKSGTNALSPDAVEAAIAQLFDLLRDGHYSQALQVMLHKDWAFEATTCDLVEAALQGPVASLAHRDTVQANGSSRNEMARWLFDVRDYPVPAGLEISNVQLPHQDWDFAEALCQNVLARRHDLGWAYDITGWSEQRAGRLAEAAKIYFSGRHASCFSNQAVRLRSHWFGQRYGKFSVAQLAGLFDQIPQLADDVYLQTILAASADQVLSDVQQYWQQCGLAQMDAADYAGAYRSFYRAGWDLGAQRLSDYQQILSLLADAAAAAGWPAREVVARTHLHCLQARLG